MSQHRTHHPFQPNLLPACFAGSLLVSAICVLAPSLVQAQSTGVGPGVLEEVTVTAQRRTERSIDVPIAITAIGAEALGKGDVQQLADIAKLTPGLRFDYASTFAQPTIRGVGNAVVVAGSGSNVGIYTDGFYSPNPLTVSSELLNVESIQVLKGPQGTLFGRNSTGGAILVTTSEPSSDTALRAEAAYSSFNTQRYQVYATGGPSESLAFDVAALLRKSDGYIDNIITGTDDDGAYENSTVRVGAFYQPSDSLSILFRYLYSDRDDNSFVATNSYSENNQPFATAANPAYGGIVTIEPGKVANGFKPTYNGESSVAQLTINYDLGFADLTSYSQYRDEKGSHTADFDQSDVSLFHFAYDNIDRVVTQEFLLASNSPGALQWTTGLFYFENTSKFDNNRGSSFGSPFIANGGSSVTTSTLAVFGDATWSLTDSLHLTAGARYSRDEVTDAYYLVGSGTLTQQDVPDIDDAKIAPRLAVRYEPSENSSIFASYTEGFKSGILNVGGGTLEGIEVDPEEIKAYEVGYKYNSGKLAFDTSVYYYDYKDLQVASYVGTASLVRNAANSTIKGIEGKLSYAVSESFDFSIGANYMKAEYEDFDQAQVWTQDPGSGFYFPSFIDASGFTMQRSPDLTATVNMNYYTAIAEGLTTVSGTLYYTSEFNFESAETYTQDAYQLLSLRAEWESPNNQYILAVFADNVTDEEYLTQALPQFYGTLATWGTPRTVGVSVGVNF